MTLGPDGWLAALDIDGTILHEDGFMSPAVRERCRRRTRAATR